MADFKMAFDHTMKHEGGYSNDPIDFGGETYRGISRRFHPDWDGWKLIDEAKTKPDFPANIPHTLLDPKVRLFYKQEFWNKFWGDEIPNLMVAEELFDTGINMGIGRAVKFLQISLNCLNRNERLYDDLVEDGAFGNRSMSALKEYLKRDDQKILLVMMNVLQGAHYIDYMRESPTQEKYARGWFKRVSLKKD